MKEASKKNGGLKMKEKTKMNLRTAFTYLAIAAFTAYAVSCVLLTDRDYSLFGKMIVRLVSLAVPYIAAFVFTLLEQSKLKVNGNVFVCGIMAFSIVQDTVFLVFGNETGVSILCNWQTERLDESVGLILMMKIVTAFAMLLVGKAVFKLYCAIIACMSTVVFVALAINNGNFSPEFPIKEISAFAADLFLYVALFFFGDLADELAMLTKWLKSMKAKLVELVDFDDFDDDDCEEEAGEEQEKILRTPFERVFPETETESPADGRVTREFFYADFEVEYTKILVAAMNEESDDFAKAHAFFEQLSEDGIVQYGKFVTAEDCVSALSKLDAKIKSLNERLPGFVTPAFAFDVELLLMNKDSINFIPDVVVASKLFMRRSKGLSWPDAMREYAKAVGGNDGQENGSAAEESAEAKKAPETGDDREGE